MMLNILNMSVGVLVAYVVILNGDKFGISAKAIECQTQTATINQLDLDCNVTLCFQLPVDIITEVNEATIHLSFNHKNKTANGVNTLIAQTFLLDHRVRLTTMGEWFGQRLVAYYDQGRIYLHLQDIRWGDEGQLYMYIDAGTRHQVYKANIVVVQTADRIDVTDNKKLLMLTCGFVLFGVVLFITSIFTINYFKKRRMTQKYYPSSVRKTLINCESLIHTVDLNSEEFKAMLQKSEEFKAMLQNTAK